MVEARGKKCMWRHYNKTIRGVLIQKSPVRGIAVRIQEFRIFFPHCKNFKLGYSKVRRWQETNDSRANANEDNRASFATTVQPSVLSTSSRFRWRYLVFRTTTMWKGIARLNKGGESSANGTAKNLQAMSNMRRRISQKSLPNRRRISAKICQWNQCQWAWIYGGASTFTEHLDYRSAKARLCRRCFSLLFYYLICLYFAEMIHAGPRANVFSFVLLSTLTIWMLNLSRMYTVQWQLRNRSQVPDCESNTFVKTYNVLLNILFISWWHASEYMSLAWTSWSIEIFM